MSGVKPTRSRPLFELAGLFLRLGTLAFGGPAAHIAMMEQEVVQRRGWLSHQEFLDLLGTINLIPGPNSTEMAIFIGYRRAGWRGLILGGACFILPAMLMVMAIAWAYLRFGSLPQAAGLLYGVKPVIIVVILQALWGLGPAAIKNRFLAIVGLAATGASLLGVNPLIVLFGAGFLVAATRWVRHGRNSVAAVLPPLGVGPPMAFLTSASAASGAAAGVPFGLWTLFVFFLKIGSVVFGSGYVLLAFLRSDLVERWHWLTASQFLDAVAVGQVTPGPVFTTATFIGYVLGGTLGSVVATVGIFLPSFILVAVGGFFVARVRRSPSAGAFLDGVNVAALALMAAVTWQLGSTALVDWVTVLLAVVAGVLLLRKVNSAWLVLGAALVGLFAAHWRT
jgi:chromate transporter